MPIPIVGLEQSADRQNQLFQQAAESYGRFVDRQRRYDLQLSSLNARLHTASQGAGRRGGYSPSRLGHIQRQAEHEFDALTRKQAADTENQYDMLKQGMALKAQQERQQFQAQEARQAEEREMYRQGYNMSFTPQDQETFNKAQQSLSMINTAVGKGEITEAEAAPMRDKYSSLMQNIRKTPIPSNEPRFPEGTEMGQPFQMSTNPAFNGTSGPLDADGSEIPMQRNEKGLLEPLWTPGKTSESSDKMSLKDETEFIQNYYDTVTKGLLQPPTPEEREQFMREGYAALRRLQQDRAPRVPQDPPQPVTPSQTGTQFGAGPQAMAQPGGGHRYRKPTPAPQVKVSGGYKYARTKDGLTVQVAQPSLDEIDSLPPGTYYTHPVTGKKKQVPFEQPAQPSFSLPEFRGGM